MLYCGIYDIDNEGQSDPQKPKDVKKIRFLFL